MGSIDHIVRAVCREPWAILPEKLAAITSLLELRMMGISLSKEDIEERIGARKTNDDASMGGMVAVLPLRGVIFHRAGMIYEMSGGISTERFSKLLREAMNEDRIKSIIIDVDSPGGYVPGVEELSAEIREARKHKSIIAVANHMAASAALWLASAASEFVAIPSGQVGSLGVMAIHVDRTEELQKAGIKVKLIRAGENKNLENPYEGLSERGLENMQSRVDRTHARFVRDVAKGRRISVEEVREKYGQGLMFDSRQAHDIGMVDKVATFEDVIASAAKPKRSSVQVASEFIDSLGYTVNVVRGDSEADSATETTETPVAGVVPGNVSEKLAPEDTEWRKPALKDFTDKNWEDLSDAEKRRIAKHYAWTPKMPPENFTDLKLPHHRSADGYVVPNGVRNSKSRLSQTQGIPSEDRPRVEGHLDAHMAAIEKRRGKQKAQAKAEVEIARHRMRLRKR